jgi:hypothetical protein
MPEDDPRVSTRAELSPEEKAAGSDDPAEQARVILEDSDRREVEREARPQESGERRSSEEATPPVE